MLISEVDVERELGADPPRGAGVAPPAWRRLWASARQRPLATAAVAVLTLCLVPVGIVAAAPNDLLVSGAVTIAGGALAARTGWERPGLTGFTLVFWGALSFFAAAWGNWEDTSRVELAAFLLWSAGLPLAAGFLFVCDQLTARVPDPESNAVLFRLATAGLVSFASFGGLFGWVADASALLLWSLPALLVSPLTHLMFIRTSSACAEPDGAVVVATPPRRARRRIVYGAALGIALLIVLETAALAGAWVEAEKRYTLDVVVSGNGVVRIDGFPCEGACDEYPYDGTKITLEAEPGSDSVFKRWLGACAPTGETPKCVVTVDADKATTAVFGSPDVVRVPGGAGRAPVYLLYRVSARLPPGVHATKNFRLPIRFTLRPGWRSLYDSRDIVLYTRRDPRGRYLVFSAQFAEVPIPEAVRYVESRKGIAVVASRRLRIGPHVATELRLEVVGAAPATLYSYAGDFERTKYTVAPDDSVRLLFVDVGAGTLTIVVESPAAGSAAFVREALRVARSVAPG